jgi:hypothetical protein
MANSTAITFSQNLTTDNSGAGAGTQWLSALYRLFHALFTDAHVVDSGRWRLVDCSPAVGDWSTITNVVDNSWFVVESFKGRQQWQCKFQATNVAALDEAPGGTYRLAASLSPGGGWTAKGDPNGGFAVAPTVASDNLLVSGEDLSAVANGVLHVHSDRDTLLVAIAGTGTTAFDGGCYVGRFDPDTDRIPYPSCLLTAWSGWPTLPAWFALACVVAISRAFVRIHHASDIIGGAILGLGLAQVALLILRSAWSLLGKSTSILREETPDSVDPDALRRELLANVPGVRDVHDLHCWSLTSGQTMLTLHVGLAPGADGGLVLRAAKRVIAEKFAIDHSALQLEQAECPDEV